MTSNMDELGIDIKLQVFLGGMLANHFEGVLYSKTDASSNGHTMFDLWFAISCNCTFRRYPNGI